MRDSIAAAKRGLPAIALITDMFWEQSIFVAKAAGMPAIPRVRLPHPVSGTGDQRLSEIADDVADTVLERLTQG